MAGARPTPLTAKGIAALKCPAGKRFVDVKDGATRGLYLRVHSTGRKVYRVRYKLDGTVRVLTIGPIGDVSLVGARARAAAVAQLVDKGLDPAGEDQRKKAEQRATPTVEQFAQVYIEKYAKENKRSWKDDEANLRNWVIPEIGKIRIDRVRKRDLVHVIDAVKAAGHVRQPSLVFAVVRRMFRFALDRDVVFDSPARTMSVPQPASRAGRALDEDEIRCWWALTHDEELALSPRLALRLLLLTGQRGSEVFGARLSEIDLEAGYWAIPSERRKLAKHSSRPDHVLPLAPLALATIKEALMLGGDEFLFPNSKGNGPESVDSRPRSILRNGFRDRPYIPVTHDARRTVATYLSDELGHPESEVARVLGHYSSSVTARYIRASEGTAGRLLRAWEARLAAIVGARSDVNVVPLRASQLQG